MKYFIIFGLFLFFLLLILVFSCTPYSVTAISGIASIATTQNSIDKMDQSSRNSLFPAYVDSLKCIEYKIAVYGHIANSTNWTVSGMKFTITYYDFSENESAILEKDDKYKLAISEHRLSINVKPFNQSYFVDTFYTSSETFYNLVCSGKTLTTFYSIDKVITSDGESQFDSGLLGI